MTNLEIAKLLRQISAAYTILGAMPAGRQENRFKVIAYDNAATAVEHATSELKDLWDDQKLDTVPGLGPSIISHLDEIFKTGQSKHFNQVLSKVNPAIFPLLEVPGIGPKKAEKLVETLHIKDPDKVVSLLEDAARKHKIAAIESFGDKSESDILENIDRYKKGAIKEKRMVLPMADMIANEIIDYLGGHVDKLGSLRRSVVTVGDIDLAVATNSPEKLIKKFVDYPKKVSLIEQGPTGASILLASGRQADLRVAKPAEYGAMLQYFTGSKYHNIRVRDLALKKGYSLNEYGMKSLKTGKLKTFPTEKELYNFITLDYIPPELREDTGEVVAALQHNLPKLIEIKEVKGDLQVHSNFDLETSHDSGVNTIKEIQLKANELGYEFVGITDHNPSSKHNSQEIIAKLKSQKSHIEHLNSSTKSTRVFSLLEVDISSDGNLPVPQDGLNYLDGCLVSIHSSFNMDKKQMTSRVIKGLSNPVARILAHPTGRLLEEREGFELDWEKVFAFCLEHDKAVEINCYPNRLDLPDTLVREAVKKGVKLSLGTDSHQKDDMVNMRYGVSVARRGWAQAKDIINTWEYDKILTWFHERR